VLTGHNDDFLIIVDLPEVQSPPLIYYSGDWNSLFFPSGITSNPYFYAYYNVEGNLEVRYTQYVNGWQTFTKTIPNATKNNIYHIVTSLNGTANINIVPMNYNLIGW